MREQSLVCELNEALNFFGSEHIVSTNKSDKLLELGGEELLSDAVAEILSHEDPERFLKWLHRSIANYFPFDVRRVEDERALVSLVTTLSRHIWNATPLPGNNFCPRPLPTPQHRDPCPCGSGLKYEHCCLQIDQGIQIDSQALWPLILWHLPDRMRQNAISSGQVPVEAITLLAQEYLDEGKPRKGLTLIEPLFSDQIGNPDDAHDYALNTLCNLYDEMGYHKKKLALLRYITQTQPRSPLRAGAWQRLATIYMDNGDSDAAWTAFRDAQRDNPDSLDIGILELHLLMASNKMEHAQERAKFWIIRLRKQGYLDNEPPLNHLLKMANDPIGALADVGIEITEGAGERLRNWLNTVTNRPIPHYYVSEEFSAKLSLDDDNKHETRVDSEVDTDEDLVSQIIERRNRGRPVSEAALHRRELSSNETPVDATEQSQLLESLSELEYLNRQWHEIFPLEKPFSVHNEPFGIVYAWDLEIENAWMGFLEAYPQAFDSLDILDDLATALAQHPHYGSEWVDHALLAPVLRRANEIIERALANQANINLAWDLAENRPALRSLVRLSALSYRIGDTQEEYRLMNRLLRLNPDDNHGYRGPVMNIHLRTGNDEKALALADRYPNDFQAETTYGRVLALFRLNRKSEAEHALCAALDNLPKVASHLMRERVRKPKLENHGFTYGSNDQAWYYREEMRDVWKATPGLIDWMKKVEKRWTKHAASGKQKLV
jgi:tetratricopeptide (TPR) repeat protein